MTAILVSFAYRSALPPSSFALTIVAVVLSSTPHPCHRCISLWGISHLLGGDSGRAHDVVCPCPGCWPTPHLVTHAFRVFYHHRPPEITTYIISVVFTAPGSAPDVWCACRCQSTPCTPTSVCAQNTFILCQILYILAYLNLSAKYVART